MRISILASAAIIGAAIVGLAGTGEVSAAPTASLVTVSPGDSLSKLAGTHQTSVGRLYSANEAVNHPDIIYAGQALRVPADSEALPERALPQATVAAPEPTAPVAAQTPTEAPRAPQATQTTAPVVPSGSVWDSLAICESGGNWAINTGNGFYGGLQFTTSSWQAVGGTGLPSQASREEQISRAQSLQAIQGWGAWPACAAKLGLR
ncbi:MAG TPA: transglycosylase family protein [Candidatus Saccharimonadales bacterium]|jgi:LysM repeat protein